MKEEIDLNKLGVKVTGLRRTNRDAITMSVGKGVQRVAAAEKLKHAVEAVLGPDAGVGLQSNLVRLKIQGICGDDDQQGLSREEVPPSQLTVKWMKPTRGGNPSALVEIPEHLALKLLKKRKIRIGLVYFRVRPQPEKLRRCYHCHGYGHSAVKCVRTSRRDRSLSCGRKDHIDRVCNMPPNCVLCQVLGRPSWDHYPGSCRCEAYQRANADASRKE